MSGPNLQQRIILLAYILFIDTNTYKNHGHGLFANISLVQNLVADLSTYF